MSRMAVGMMAVSILAANGCATVEEEEEVVRSDEAMIVADSLREDGDDDGTIIDRALDAARERARSGQPVVVDLAPRTYRITRRTDAKPRWHRFALEGLNDVTIRGHGAKLLFAEEDMLAFDIDRCRNVLLDDLVLDHLALPFTQGTIRTPDTGASFVVDVDAGYPMPSDALLAGTTTTTKPANAIVFGADGRTAKPGLPRSHFQATALRRVSGSPRSVRITVEDAARATVPALRGGERIAIALGFTTLDRARDQSVDDPVGEIVVARSTGVEIRSVRMYTSPDKAARVFDNHGPVTFNSVSVAPPVCDGPNADHEACARRSTRRLVSVVRDGIHAKNNRASVIVDGSSFTGIMDDAINITSLPYAVERRDDGSFALTNRDRPYVYPVRCGDRLRFFPAHAIEELEDEIRAAGRVVHETTVKCAPGAIAPPLAPGTKTQILHFVSPPPAGTERIVAFDLSAANDGFRIATSRFSVLHNRAISATGADGIIVDNVIHGVGGGAIWLANWPQAGAGPWARGAFVARNRIVDPTNTPGIRIGALFTGGASERMRVRVRLENNFIETSHAVGVHVTHASGVWSKGDEIRMVAGRAEPLLPRHVAVRLEDVDDVSLTSLRVLDGRVGVPRVDVDAASKPRVTVALAP